MVKMVCPISKNKVEIDVPEDCPKECKHLIEGMCKHTGSAELWGKGYEELFFPSTPAAEEKRKAD